MLQVPVAPVTMRGAARPRASPSTPGEGKIVNRQWSRAGARVASVVLLVAGAAGGIRLGEGRHQPTGRVDLSFQAQTDETQLMKARQNEHVAARAWQREAE